MQPSEFDHVFVDIVSSRDVVVSLIGEVDGEMTPVGFVGGYTPGGGQLMFVNEFLWFPWARKRHKLSCAANFINEIRDAYRVMLFADTRPKETSHDGTDTKSFYEHLCRYGIIRRVGTMHDFAGPGISAAVFESRQRKN